MNTAFAHAFTDALAKAGQSGSSAPLAATVTKGARRAARREEQNAAFRNAYPFEVRTQMRDVKQQLATLRKAGRDDVVAQAEQILAAGLETLGSTEQALADVGGFLTHAVKNPKAKASSLPAPGWFEFSGLGRDITALMDATTSAEEGMLTGNGFIIGFF